MDDHRRQQLVEQYEDIAFSLLMDDYANEDGARLLKEFEKAQQNGDLPEIPAELDEKCRELIDRSFSRQERNALLTRIGKSLAKAAVFVLVFLGLSTITIMSVDALRIPVLNFFMQHTDRYSSIRFDESEDNTSIQDNIVNSILAAPIPEEYQLVTHRVQDDGSVYIHYKNDTNQVISFTVKPTNGELNVDTEDADPIETTVNGHKAFFIDKECYYLIWLDSSTQLVYELFTNGLGNDSFWTLVYALAE